MQVYIMRHGEAEMFAQSDAQRALTASGEAEVQKVATWLSQELDQFDYVLVSPYLRAQQTWKIVEQTISATRVIEMSELTPSGDEQAVAALVSEFAEESPNASLLAVSHLPLVGYLVAALSPDAGAPLFSTAAVAKISLAQQANFDFIKHPYMLSA